MHVHNVHVSGQDSMTWALALANGGGYAIAAPTRKENGSQHT